MFEIIVGPVKNQACRLFCSKKANAALNKISVVSRTDVRANMTMALAQVLLSLGFEQTSERSSEGGSWRTLLSRQIFMFMCLKKTNEIAALCFVTRCQ